jgi:hypothetical protein
MSYLKPPPLKSKSETLRNFSQDKLERLVIKENTQLLELNRLKTVWTADKIVALSSQKSLLEVTLELQVCVFFGEKKL